MMLVYLVASGLLEILIFLTGPHTAKGCMGQVEILTKTARTKSFSLPKEHSSHKGSSSPKDSWKKFCLCERTAFKAERKTFFELFLWEFLPAPCGCVRSCWSRQLSHKGISKKFSLCERTAFLPSNALKVLLLHGQNAVFSQRQLEEILRVFS